MLLTQQEARKLRVAEIKLLWQLRPRWMLTFSAGYSVGSIKLQQNITRWLNTAQRRCYGRDWAKQFDRPWPEAHGYFEHKKFDHPHFHTLCDLAIDLAKWIVADQGNSWREICPRGQLDVRWLDTNKDILKVIRYCTKDFDRRHGYEEKYIYKDTRAATTGRIELQVGKES